MDARLWALRVSRPPGPRLFERGFRGFLTPESSIVDGVEMVPRVTTCAAGLERGLFWLLSGRNATLVFYCECECADLLVLAAAVPCTEHK